MKTLSDEYGALRGRVGQGGGPDKARRQNEQGKLAARERVTALLDPDGPWLEIGLLVAWDQYDGQAPAAGVVTGLGRIGGGPAGVGGHDATGKAGTVWRAAIQKNPRPPRMAERQSDLIAVLARS